MKKTVLLIACLSIIASTKVLAQTPITVVESTLKVGSLGDEILYYGFAQGDKVLFNFEETEGKELKEIEITEWPASSKFRDYKTKKVDNQVLYITQTGVYKFRFSNSSLGKRVCKFKIQRIPANTDLANFNTNVYWHSKADTCTKTIQEKYLIKNDTSFQEFYASSIELSARKTQVVEFTLPDKTISWAYYIGTDKKGQEEFKHTQNRLLECAAGVCAHLPGYGSMAALALTGVSYFNKLQGGNMVSYAFLSNKNSVALFNSHGAYKQYKQGKVINEASQMKAPLKGRVYLGLANDNLLNPISVSINATAVIVKPKWGTRSVQKIEISAANTPYLKD